MVVQEMPSWKEAEREISLNDGESVTAVIDPSRELDLSLVDGKTRYTVHLRVEGEPASISGGKRLKNAFLIAGITRWTAPTKVQITALGAARSFDRTYEVVVK